MKFGLQVPTPAYRIETAGGSLRVERREGPGSVLPRLGLSLPIAAFAALPPAALWAFIEPQGATRVLWTAVLTLFFVFPFPWYPALALFAWVGGEIFGSWRTIEVRADGVRGVKDGFFLWGRRRVSVPRGTIRDILVSGRPTGGGVKGRARIEVKHEGRRWLVLPGPRTTVFTLNQPSLLERDALLEFAFSVARTIGFAHYEIHRDDHLNLTVGLEEGPGAATEPVPPAGAGGGGESEDRLAGRGIPERDLPPFDPAIRGSGYEVLDYRPGERVHIRKQGLTVAAALWTSVLGTVLFNVPTLAAGWAIWGRGVEVGIFWQGVVVAVFAFVTFLFNLYVWGVGRTTREAELDWSRSVCHLRRNDREVRVPLSHIEEVEVRGYRLRTAHPERRYSYRCEVLLRTPDGLGEVFRTGSEPLGDRVYRQAASLAEDLAEALDVTWRFGGWRDRTLWEETKEMGRTVLALQSAQREPAASTG